MRNFNCVKIDLFMLFHAHHYFGPHPSHVDRDKFLSVVDAEFYDAVWMKGVSPCLLNGEFIRADRDLTLELSVLVIGIPAPNKIWACSLRLLDSDLQTSAWS